MSKFLKSRWNLSEKEVLDRGQEIEHHLRSRGCMSGRFHENQHRRSSVRADWALIV